MINLAVCYPAYHQQIHVQHAAFAARLGVLSTGVAFQISRIRYTDSCFIDWARDKMLYDCLREEGPTRSDWMLQLDADLVPQKADDVVQMIQDADYQEAVAIGACYKQRKVPVYAGSIRQPDGNFKRIEEEDFKGKIIPIDRIGTGCLAINLNWIRENWPQQPWFMAVRLAGPEPKKLGEDFYFCDELIKKTGQGKLLCDGRFEPIHFE